MGCECLQVFAKSPRQWTGPPIDPDAATRFIALREELGIGPLCTHTAYLINLATCDEGLWERSIAALADELLRGRMLGASYVVTHIGADPAGDRERAVARIGVAADRALAVSGTDCESPMLLLENTAGAGHQFGATFEEIGAVLNATHSDAGRIGVCLDTCHAHAYGHDLTSVHAWPDLMRAIEEFCGPGALRVVHANDCAFEAGSKRDRHAWIGDGTIGTASFASMLGQASLDGVCAITEMPGEAPIKDATNIARLIGLRDGRHG